MKLIYVAGPYRGDVENNVETARRAGQEVMRVAPGQGLAVVPHVLGRAMTFEGDGGDGFWLEATLELLARCDIVYAIPGWLMSDGAFEEVQWAAKMDIPVVYTLDELRSTLAEEV